MLTGWLVEKGALEISRTQGGHIGILPQLHGKITAALPAVLVFEVPVQPDAEMSVSFHATLPGSRMMNRLPIGRTVSSRIHNFHANKKPIASRSMALLTISGIPPSKIPDRQMYLQKYGDACPMMSTVNMGSKMENTTKA